MNPESITTPVVAEYAIPRFDSFEQRAVLRALGAMPRGHLRLEVPGTGVLELGAKASDGALPPGIASTAQIRVVRPGFFKKSFWAGDIGFAESYLDGDWETPDIAAVVAWFILNLEHAPTLSGTRAKSAALNALRFANRLGHLLRPNSRRIARRNIGEHYDLSNDFFALFLDETMMYSGAHWAAAGDNLGAAQQAKNEALCRKLQLKAGDRVLEIGTGWGGWAIHAARTHGCHVTSVTISRQQYDLAVARVRAAGLGDRVHVELKDYRDLSGAFDKVVSIEMMEALGHRYLPEFCSVVSRVLKPDGLLALQFITCPDARYEQFRRGVDFIQKHVFPGSLLLSLNRVNDQLTRAGGFVLHGVTDHGSDYALTLRAWHQRFRERLDDVRALGFDQRFIRKWSYYLGYCEAAFAMRNISVVQTVHTRANNLSLAASAR